MVPTTGEVGYQLSIADHEKQATTWTQKQQETRLNVKTITDHSLSIEQISCLPIGSTVIAFVLPSANHHCHTVGNSNITAKKTKKNHIMYLTVIHLSLGRPGT